MRWKQPLEGQRDVRRSFLWWPKTIDGETRWLERASWVVEWVQSHTGRYGEPVLQPKVRSWDHSSMLDDDQFSLELEKYEATKPVVVRTRFPPMKMVSRVETKQERMIRRHREYNSGDWNGTED